MISAAPKFPKISGYTVTEQIYLGSRTAVYRAIRDSQNVPVVIKVLQREYPTFGELVQFRNQYAIAKNLPITGIIQPLNLEPFGNSYALIMADWGGISLETYIQQQPLEIADILTIAIQLADILQELQQHRVIHKDIKPANILIHPQSKQVKLIDFSIASLLPKETQEIQNPSTLEGTLAYLAPEQTGRMNRGIDYRSDFYALGVTLYQMLTSRLPFIADDPLELVHCHIAKIATLAHEVNIDVPPMLGTIVAKLMAKNAEDRYQSALGLKHDLDECLRQWQQTGSITEFELGQRDLCDRFLIPEKLYGRETEVQTLLDAFERVAVGTTEIMLVAGFSGIGKTAVVNEVHKPIVKQRGYFIKGKFDQFNRNVPLSAFVQAFRDLVGQLLSESDTQLQYWKTQILATLGENAQVIIELIPELERIIGAQPPAPELSGTAAQNRFNLLFQRFIQVFTQPAHPLVMFVDDLQWADSASLNLIQLLMSESQTGCLLLLGAYRDNEVFAAHPLMLTLEGMEKAGATINTITLQPLSFTSLNHLIADTLHAPTSVVKPLTELVMQNTQGNPFFATQFLKVLHQDQLITFDSNAGYWQCDIVQVRDAALTDDVVELMAQQLQKLPQATQEILKLAACIGAQFDLTTLAIVSQQPPTDVAATLWKALQEGLILPQSDLYKFYLEEIQATQHSPQETLNYRFLHDRVQQAAYSLIPDNQKQATHYQIGRLLLQNTSEQEQEENIFYIISHLNISAELITTQQEKDQLAKLNYIAGEKALASTAYVAATKYFEMGIKCLGEDGWQSHYTLTLSLYQSAVKAEYLNINFVKAQNLVKFILERTISLIDRVKTYELQIQIHMAQSEMQKALDVGTFTLGLLGVDLNNAPSSSEIHLPALDTIESLPVMQDVHQIAIMRIIMSIVAAAHTAKPALLSPLVLTMLDLSLKQGHTSLTAYAYGFYGLLLCSSGEDLDKGYYSGLLALEVLDLFYAKDLECKVKTLFDVFIRPWKEPLANTIESLERASQVGFEVGDIEYAGYTTTHCCTHQFLSGKILTETQKAQSTALEILSRINQAHSLGHTQIWQQLVSKLLAPISETQQFLGNDFDTTLLLAFCAGNDRSHATFCSLFS